MPPQGLTPECVPLTLLPVSPAPYLTAKSFFYLKFTVKDASKIVLPWG